MGTAAGGGGMDGNSIAGIVGGGLGGTILQLGRPANNLIQELECLALFIGKQLGITDHVDEKNMRNFEMKIRFTLSGHRRRDAEVMHQSSRFDRQLSRTKPERARAFQSRCQRHRKRESRRDVRGHETLRSRLRC